MRWIAKVMLCIGLAGCAADGIDDTDNADEVDLTTVGDDIEIEPHYDALTLPNVFKTSQVVKGATLTCARVTTSFPTRCIGPRINGRPIVSNNRWDAAVAICRAVIHAEGRTANTIGDSRLLDVIRYLKGPGRWENAPSDGRIVTDISCHAGQRRSLRGTIRVFDADLTCDDVIESFPIRCIGPRIGGLPLIARSRWDLAEVVCQLVIGVRARTSNTIGDARVLAVWDLDRPREHFFRTSPSGRIVTDFSCFAPPFPD